MVAKILCYWLCVVAEKTNEYQKITIYIILSKIIVLTVLNRTNKR